jgi:hypothetical protein
MQWSKQMPEARKIQKLKLPRGVCLNIVPDPLERSRLDREHPDIHRDWMARLHEGGLACSVCDGHFVFPPASPKDGGPVGVAVVDGSAARSVGTVCNLCATDVDDEAHGRMVLGLIKSAHGAS